MLRNAGESLSRFLLKTEAPAGDVSRSERERSLTRLQRHINNHPEHVSDLLSFGETLAQQRSAFYKRSPYILLRY